MTTLYNKKGEEVGEYNQDSHIYFTIRDASKNQVFIHGEHRGFLAIDVDIISKLVQMKCEMIHILVLNYEDRPFKVEISLNDFLQKSERIEYGKFSVQRRVHLDNFNRLQSKVKQDNFSIKKTIKKSIKKDNSMIKKTKKALKSNLRQVNDKTRQRAKALWGK